jgi:hypothetical protein
MYDSKHWHHNDSASKPENLILFDDGNWQAYDLERETTICIPNNIRKVAAYSEQILCVETWDAKDYLMLFNVDKQSFINTHKYTAVGFPWKSADLFRKGFEVCSTDRHLNIIVFKDGSQYVIPYEKTRMESGYNCNHIFYSEEILETSKLNERGYDIKFTIFNYHTKALNSFIYHWDFHGIRANSVEDDKYVIIASHSMKYEMTTVHATLDLMGNRIKSDSEPYHSKKKMNNKFEPPIYFDEETLFRHIIRSNYVNNKYLPDYNGCFDDMEYTIKNGYAIVGWRDDYDSGGFIGYADVERCYWRPDKIKSPYK